MVLAAKDSAPVAVSHSDAMKSYGDESAHSQVIYIPAVKILNDRGEFSATMGCLPPAWRPWVKKSPWGSKGSLAVKNLAGIAVAAVAKRLTTPTDRVDLLSKLQEGKDDEGKPMGRGELTAEALTQLIAGSDTTSKCVLLLKLPFIRFLTVWQLVLRDHLSPRSQSSRPTKTPKRTRRSPQHRRYHSIDLRTSQTPPLSRSRHQRSSPCPLYFRHWSTPHCT